MVLFLSYRVYLVFMNLKERLTIKVETAVVVSMAINILHFL